MRLVILLLLTSLVSCGKPKNGDVGGRGPAGADGTVITTLKFCPGSPSTYPSTFPEYGLCIAGQVYAVYSTNDGFLTLVPPGTYNSNAVGSACTFTLLTDCQLQ